MDKTPTEILEKIFGHLGPRDQFHIAQTCRKFHQIAMPLAWHLMCVVIDNRWQPEAPKITVSLNNELYISFRTIIEKREKGLDKLLGYIRELEIIEYAKPLPVIGPKSEYFNQLRELQPLVSNLQEVRIKRNLMGRSCSYKTLAEQFLVGYSRKLLLSYVVHSMAQIPDGLYDMTRALTTQDSTIAKALPPRLDYLSFAFQPGSENELRRSLGALANLKTLEIKGHWVNFHRWVPDTVENLIVEITKESLPLENSDDASPITRLAKVKDLTIIARGGETVETFRYLRAPNVERLTLCFDSKSLNLAPVSECIAESRKVQELSLFCSPQSVLLAVSPVLMAGNIREITFAQFRDEDHGAITQMLDSVLSLRDENPRNGLSVIVADSCWSPAVPKLITEKVPHLSLLVPDERQWEYISAPLMKGAKNIALIPGDVRSGPGGGDASTSTTISRDQALYATVKAALEKAQRESQPKSKDDQEDTFSKQTLFGVVTAVTIMLLTLVPDFYPSFYQDIYDMLPRFLQVVVDFLESLR